MPVESTVILIDDHAAVRAGYKRFIDSEHDLRVIGEAGNAEQAFSLLMTQECDVLVMDISMPGQSGLDLIRRVRLKWPKLPIVILSMHDSPVVASKALGLGAKGYVTKSSPPEELVHAIRVVLGGCSHLSGDIEALGTPLETANIAGNRKEADDALNALSPRELDIIRLLSEGKTIDQAALALGISSKTVSNNLSAIRQKLGVQTDFELAFWAWSHGVATPPPNFTKQG